MGRIEKVSLFNHSHHIDGLIILRYNNYHLKMSVIGYVIQSHNQLQDLETLFHNLHINQIWSFFTMLYRTFGNETNSYIMNCSVP